MFVDWKRYYKSNPGGVECSIGTYHSAKKTADKSTGADKYFPDTLLQTFDHYVVIFQNKIDFIHLATGC
jgi:hypothetical protein